MIKLFRYQYLSFQRSTYWEKSILLNLLLVIIGIYLLLNIVVIGLYVDGLIQIVYGLSDTISLLSGFLLFYFLLDFFARFLMQNTRLPDLLPFLILPISKRKLIHYALGKTLFSIFNLLAACFFVPYFIKVVLLNRSLTFSIGWLASVLILVFINNFLAVSLKRQYVRHPLFIAITIITFGMLLYINHSALLNLTGYFASLLIWLASQPWRVVFPLMLLFLSYFVAYQSMHKQLYLEDHENKSTKGYIESSNFSKRRQIVNLVVLELKMIWPDCLNCSKTNPRKENRLVKTVIKFAWQYHPKVKVEAAEQGLLPVLKLHLPKYSCFPFMIKHRKRIFPTKNLTNC